MTITSPWRGGLGKEGSDEDDGCLFLLNFQCQLLVDHGRSMILFFKMNNVIVSKWSLR